MFVSKGHKSKVLKGCLLISVKYLAEIIYLYLYFPRFSCEILPILTGTLSKLDICALTFGNKQTFQQQKIFLKEDI